MLACQIGGLRQAVLRLPDADRLTGLWANVSVDAAKLVAQRFDAQLQVDATLAVKANSTFVKSVPDVCFTSSGTPTEVRTAEPELAFAWSVSSAATCRFWAFGSFNSSMFSRATVAKAAVWKLLEISLVKRHRVALGGFIPEPLLDFPGRRIAGDRSRSECRCGVRCVGHWFTAGAAAAMGFPMNTSRPRTRCAMAAGDLEWSRSLPRAPASARSGSRRRVRSGAWRVRWSRGC